MLKDSGVAHRVGGHKRLGAFDRVHRRRRLHGAPDEENSGDAPSRQ